MKIESQAIKELLEAATAAVTSLSERIADLEHKVKYLEECANTTLEVSEERKEYIESLEEVLRLKDLELSKQWISCNDSPVNNTTDWTDGDVALALSRDGHVIEIVYDDGIWCSITGDDFDYWMPVPEFPEEFKK